MKRWYLKCLLVFSLLPTAAGCSAEPFASSGQPSGSIQGAASSARLVTAKVDKVVDGDTIDVDYKGKTTAVRMLLIDTPETHHPKLGVQPYGPEASQLTHQLLDGKTAQLELGKNGGHDKYGRLLAYVYIGGKSVEEALLSRGLARVAYVFEPNTKYVSEYRAVQKQAQEKELGVWSVKGYATGNGFHPEVMKGTPVYTEAENYRPAAANASASSAGTSQTGETSTGRSGGLSPDSGGNCNGAIKGNISGRGKIYHLPSDSSYKLTKAEACFKTVKDAESAGFRAPK